MNTFRRAFVGGGVVALTILSGAMLSSFRESEPAAENTAPVVRMTLPAANAKFQWNAMVNYTIHVNDKEDGNSEYDEIAPHEVLLQVLFLSDSAQLQAYRSERSKTEPEPEALLTMTTLPCFNCHTANDKLIGPSFQQIAAKYPYSASMEDALSKKIIGGSLGTWGNIPMPPHPEVQAVQAKEIARWILKSNKDADHFYLTGISGAFKTRMKPVKDAGKGVYLLRASYTDHGLKDNPQQRKRGQYTLMLKN
ncbi:c-type cytochrome [Chryseolinea soli]|uniref:c-type cytochrome n=1 Tax=Chryseolinea soli TaxID=2321403 RepID=UPI00135CA6E6|nr:c-type cytochrome [Chryseolinea soli]